MKAINTMYNGYRFRSRLEARWAVFFDAARIEYEYEPEGFKLEDGTRYLPDFYLPEYGWYAEVKAPRDGIETDLQRACKFVGNGIDVLLLLGNIPKKRKYPVWHYHALYYNPLRMDVMVGTIVLGCQDEQPRFDGWLAVDRDKESGSGILYASLSSKAAHMAVTPINDVEMYDGCDCGPWAETLDRKDLEVLDAAYDAARSARFEFGEKPAINE